MFKTYSNYDTLTAADANAFIKQGIVPVANATERDLFFPAPTQGSVAYRTDRGWIEQYFGLWNATTNVLGAKVAGWYPVAGKLPRARLFVKAIGGIATGTQYCFATTDYVETPTNNYADNITYTIANGRFVANVAGRFRVKCSMILGTSSASSIVLSASVNSTSSPIAPRGTGDGYSINAVQTANECPSSTVTYMPLWLDNEVQTTAATDYIQVWFSAGTGTSNIIATTGGGAVKASVIDITYLGPPVNY